MTWTEAIENLRQRDKNIKQMRDVWKKNTINERNCPNLKNVELFQELETYRQYTVSKQNNAQEKLDFLNTQKANNDEVERELFESKSILTQKVQELKNLTDNVKSLENEVYD